MDCEDRDTRGMYNGGQRQWSGTRSAARARTRDDGRRYARRERRFVLNVEKDRVEGVPGFDEDHWTDMADQSWTRQIHSYCGTEPYSNEARAQGVGVPEVR